MAWSSGVQSLTPSGAFGSAPCASICFTVATSPSRTAPMNEPIAATSRNEMTCRMTTICYHHPRMSMAFSYKVQAAPYFQVDEHPFPLAFAEPLHDFRAGNDV